jgi:hydroxyacylglutathione hydrolase
MILKRFYDEKLAQASYLIGCAATGDALVVDPNRDVDQYIRMAASEGVAITHVTETHIHADFVSGARELVERTGARLYLSDEGDASWKYGYAKQYDAVLVKHGHTFMVGNVRIEVLHTPGHTPEHISFLVTDTAAADKPIGILSGDFVFVGDVGRPDLLERAAKVAGTMEAGARALFESLQRFKSLPDYLQIWPGHGAGSACGKGLSAIPHSTVGYERLFNWGLGIESEEEFVRAVLAGQPEPPRYFAEMKRINKEGPPVLGGFRRPPRLEEARMVELIRAGALAVDTRPAGEFSEGHAPGMVNIPLARSFTTWAGWLIPYDRDFYLLVDDSCPHCLDQAVRDLAMIGLDRVAGWFGTDALETWVAQGGEPQVVPQIASGDLAEMLEGPNVAVLDVRGATEWEAGHLPGAPNIPVGYLTERLAEIPRDKTLVLQCRTGARSSIAASVLQAKGFDNVFNLAGGYVDWVAGGHPVERAGETRAAAA